MRVELLKFMRRVRRAIGARARRAPAALRAAWVRYVSRRPFWYTDRNGITLELLPADNLTAYLSQRMLFDDAGTAALLARVVRPGMTVFDVGAHTGAFALLAARYLGEAGAVHAFEPAAATFGRLARNLAHSPRLAARVVANRIAVAAADGELVLHTFPPEYSAWNSFGQPRLLDDRRRPRSPTGSELVRTVTVDSYCRERGVARVDLLKIDVEGFEDDVARGCAAMLARDAIPWVIFEISLAPLDGAGKTPRGILQAFRDLGFALYLIGPAGELAPVGPLEQFAAPYFANYFGVRSGAPPPPGLPAG